jgi:hypothetical protein
MCKADNAVQVTKTLKDMTNQSISSQTVHCNLREFGLRPVGEEEMLSSQSTP